jgi:predicted permease
LPVSKPTELVSIFTTDLQTPGELGVSRLNFLDLKERTKASFADMLSYLHLPILVQSGGNIERARGALVTANYCDVLGIVPQLGRAFKPDEDTAPGASPIIMLTDGFWSSHFGRDPSVIGRSVLINKHAFTVIGVLPRRFTGTSLTSTPDIWLPMSMYAQADPNPDWYDARRAISLMVLGRLRPGVTLVEAQTAVSVTGNQLSTEYPEDNRGRNFKLVPFLAARLHVGPIGSIYQTLRIVSMVVGMILVIGCSNVALQMLTRKTQRAKLNAIQEALGATKYVVFAEWMIEVMLLCLSGGLLGIFLAATSAKFLTRLMPITNGVEEIVALDYRAIFFALILVAVSTVVCGVIPLLGVPRINLADSMKQQSSTWRGHSGLPSIKKVLVFCQIVFCVVPLISAGLLIRSLTNAWSIYPGFRTDHVIMLKLDLGLGGYNNPSGQGVYERITKKVEALPGVRGAVIVRHRPLEDGVYRSIFIEGQDPAQGKNSSMVRTNVIGENYFHILNIPLLEGRNFVETDSENTPSVIIINEQMAKIFWPGQKAVGKRLKLFGDREYREVVAVCKNSKLLSVTEDPSPMIYLPLKQFYVPAASVFVFTSSDEGGVTKAVRTAIASEDPSLQVFDVRSVREQVDQSLAEPTRLCALVALLGILGLVLAGSGIYGVVSHMVADKYHEIGIRLALGARRIHIVGILLWEMSQPILVGLAVGSAVAYWISNVIRSSLFGIVQMDPVTYGLACGTVLLMALVAGISPTLRAIRIDPALIVKTE